MNGWNLAYTACVVSIMPRGQYLSEKRKEKEVFFFLSKVIDKPDKIHELPSPASGGESLPCSHCLVHGLIQLLPPAVLGGFQVSFMREAVKLLTAIS